MVHWRKSVQLMSDFLHIEWFSVLRTPLNQERDQTRLMQLVMHSDPLHIHT